MALPKGTEHFLADLHGESGAFQHVLKNASGNIKRKVNELFGNNIRESEKKELCTLIYYPEQKLELIKTRELMRDTVNDDQLNEALEEKKLKGFAASLMQVLSDEAELDEGFMPLLPVENRQTNKIRKLLTNHLRI